MVMQRVLMMASLTVMHLAKPRAMRWVYHLEKQMVLQRVLMKGIN